MTDRILKYLQFLIPFPVCELNYNSDYELLIAIMLSAQTTDRRVNLVTEELFFRYDSIDKLANASVSDVEKIIYSLGSYTKKAAAVVGIAGQIVKWGCVPRDRFLLEGLPMVGRKTVSVFLSEFYREPNIAVDTHVERVSKRLGLVRCDASVLEVEKSLKKKISKNLWCDTHLRMVHFGRYFCLSRNPKCDECGLKDICKYEEKR